MSFSFDEVLNCPLIHRRMQDPVTIACNKRHTFDFEGISQWFDTHHTCPICLTFVLDKRLYTNPNILYLLNFWKDANISQQKPSSSHEILLIRTKDLVNQIRVYGQTTEGHTPLVQQIESYVATSNIERLKELIDDLETSSLADFSTGIDALKIYLPKESYRMLKVALIFKKVINGEKMILFLVSDTLKALKAKYPNVVTIVNDLINYYDLYFPDRPPLDFSPFSSHLFWKKTNTPSNFHEISFATQEQIDRSTALTYNPKWAKNKEDVKEYYEHHQETDLDRLIGWVTCDQGVIIHGDLTQDQLARKLISFDVKQLLKEGPCEHPALSINAQKLIYESLQLPIVLDLHLHNHGHDEGNFLNPEICTLEKSQRGYFNFLALKYASGISDPIGSTHEARRRIHLYAQHFPKLSAIVLPMHKAYLENQTKSWELSGNFLKNRSAFLTAKSFYNEDSELLYGPAIHPFDPKWESKLHKAYERGLRLIKWVPPQGIPPDSDCLHDFYKTLKKFDMILIAHAGPKQSIPMDETSRQWQDWGNPLRFRLPLKLGVPVILAHCGHKNKMIDHDHPEKIGVPGYQLFLRLAKEAHQKNQTQEWTGKLYGDLAAATHYGPEYMASLLKHANEEGIRLFYGSDYPYTHLVIKPKKDPYDTFANAGLLDQTVVQALKEIRALNPLLGNYIFTRNLCLKEDGRLFKFPDATFTGKFKDGELQFIDKSAWKQYTLV